MKTGIAIALIVCGTFLVVTPAVHDYLLVRSLSGVLLSRTDLLSVNVGEPMSSAYRFVCWALGAAMIGIAVVRSLRMPQTSLVPGRPAIA